MLSSVRRPPPQVTGISPKEGPPGTRVTIRGEDLGVEPRDLIGLRICGVDCLLSAEWKSSNKIIARTGQAKGKGEIIVCTRSGGVGSSTVHFRGYIIQIGPLQESAVWIDELQAFGRNRASSPLTQEHDNALGICDESNDKRFSAAKLQEMFPEGCGSTALENFDPAWFLLENHSGTRFDDLKAGLAHLERKSSTRSEGPREFVKTNLTTFLDCYDTLTDMHKKITADQSTLEGSVTQNVEDILQESNKAAIELFNDVLARKDRADATRNALAVLQRFKFLFNLPCTMERNIRRGDYDLVITDYTRAKSLFGDSDVQLFRKVYEEVEKRISEFRQMLYKKLLELPATVEDQKKLIRYLGHLDQPGDAAWECLCNMHQWQLGVLNTSKDSHIAKDLERLKEISNPLSPRLPSSSYKESFSKPGKLPQRILFVEELTKILTETLPDLWRLGQSYFSGKMLKEVKNAPKIDPNKRTRFNVMVKSVVEYFCKLVRAAFLPRTLKGTDSDKYGVWRENKKDSPSAWLPTCVRYTRACALSLTLLDLPNEAMELLQQLAFDMRANCMTLLFKQAAEDVKNLHSKETWEVDTDDERGGTTLLPAIFENIVSETLQQLQEVIHPKQGDAELFSEPEIQTEAFEMCVQLLQSFAATAEQLALLGNVERETKGRRSALSPDLFSPGHIDGMPSLDKRLIVMMSNCTHTKVHILPRLVEALEKHGYPETVKVQAAASWCYQSLDERLFDKYIEEKSNPIIGVLEQNMYSNKFDWNKCSRPTVVRSYVQEALMGIIQVHAEVYSICPSFVPRVMYRLIEYVMDEISRLFQCVSNFCSNGAIQGRLEIYALDAALGYYKTDETCAALKEALNCIPDIEIKEDEKLIHELLGRFKVHHKFMLMCFKPDKRIRNSQYF